MASDKQFEQMQSLMLEQIAASQAETEAKIRAAQVSEQARDASQKAVETNMEMIEGIKSLMRQNTVLVEQIEPLQVIQNQLVQLLSTTQALVSVIGGLSGVTAEQSRELRRQMQELALAAASRGVKVHTGSENNVSGSSFEGDFTAGNKS